MTSRIIEAVLAIGALVFLAACGSSGESGGGGGETPPAATPQTGVFIDGPVQGLGYSAVPSGLSGITNAGGQYNFMPGDTVMFTLFGRPIGAAVLAGPVVTPLTVFNTTNLSDPRVLNLAQLLLTLGGIPSGTDPIVVPATPPANFPATIDFSAPGFDTSFPGLTLVSEGAATTHLAGSFKTLSVTIVNSGTVTSSPAGINCTAGTCAAAFTTGTIVTLTAIGTGFTGWSGVGCSGSGACVVTLNADSTVTATFPVAPPPATLTINPNPGAGTGQVQCSTGGAFGPCATSYPHGTALTLRGVANSGSTFTGWSGGTGSIGCTGIADCATTLTADSSVTATFTLNPTLFTVTANTATTNGGGGTVQCSANGGAASSCGSYPVGSAMVLTATPNSVSNFTGWTGAGCSGTSTCSFTLTANTTVTANFNRPVLTVTVIGTGTVSSSPTGINNCTSSCAAVFNRGTSVTLTAGAGFTGWSGGGCAGTGTCVVPLTANVTVTANFGGAGLPPFAFEAYVKASNTEANDEFGEVALSGDTLAVGARFESSAATGVNANQADNSARNSGAVYVFTRTSGVWSQQAYLKASNTGPNDQFGISVALSGDTLAVGAPGEASAATGVNGNQADDSAFDSGAVYVFTRTAGVWSQQAYLKASNTGPNDQFGISVALSGNTLAVGAYIEASAATGVNGNQADNSARNSGAVYVFTRTGGVWSQQAYVKASNTGADNLFGSSVALSGDTLAVGAIGESSSATGINGNQADNSAAQSGAVYVFTRTGGVWSQQAYVKASNTGAFDHFGFSVALAGDTMAVGATFEDSAATGVNGNQADNSAVNSGAVYVFTRTGGVWSQQAYVKASNTDASDRFGISVALADDTIAVGAIFEGSTATGVNGNQANNGDSSGAVYVFTRTGGVWSQQAYVKASNTGAFDHFGFSVALAGDTMAVGAWAEASAAVGINGNQADNSALRSGAVYVYRAQ